MESRAGANNAGMIRSSEQAGPAVQAEDTWRADAAKGSATAYGLRCFEAPLIPALRAAASREVAQSLPWLGLQGANSYYRERSSPVIGLPQDARLLPCKATLVSPQGANTPILRAVSVGYR